ncbi:MAG: hypothetical protein H7247_12760, partial [Polaromonas sp.]|nr:hypothetical protein [Gemmatimonadaceae bacterium]
MLAGHRSVAEQAVDVYDPEAAAGAQYYAAGKRTVNTYSAFGELVQIARLKNASADSATAASNELRYYDNGGRLCASVDAANYLTAYSYDGLCNLTQTS